MSFKSIEFFIFFPLFFLIYWFILDNIRRAQNVLIVLASYIFYAWWDWRFLGLIFLSSISDYIIALGMHGCKTEGRRKELLILSVAINIGTLIIFKYFNFFADALEGLASIFGLNISIITLNVILPIGLSFYTFQSLSYTLDVYNKKVQAEKGIFEFFGFVSFFPQLVAGPIEKARDLLPQFYQNRRFNYPMVVAGARQLLWGFFKKIVIADNCSIQVEHVFNNYQNLNGSAILLGALLFTLQIYCDFSGYSDIAIGSAKMLGFRLSTNFKTPLFATNIIEFWKRWHITLNNWFIEYVYIPLGGAEVKRTLFIRNIIIVFFLSGLWHGANYTYIFWALSHSLLYLFTKLIINKINLPNLIRNQEVILKLLKILFITANLLFLANTFIIFRSQSLMQGYLILRKLWIENFFKFPGQILMMFREFLDLRYSFIILITLIIERVAQSTIVKDFFSSQKIFRWLIYIFLFLTIIFEGNLGTNDFIYFKF